MFDRSGGAATRLASFSTVLLELYRLAREESLERFHQTALECLRPLLPFEMAWWGRAAQAEDGPHEHSSFLFGLPDGYIDDWKAIRHEDVTVGRVHAQPGVAVVVDMQAAELPAGLRWLGERYDIGELLCVIHTDPITQLSDHLALYRTPGAEAFGDAERELLSCLMPHLTAAASLNQIRTMQALRETLYEQRLALAVCDQVGMLQSAEPGFVDLLLTEWPDWAGPQLPAKVKPQGYDGGRLSIEARPVNDLYLLTARYRCAMEQLSARESDVARLFGEGRTYKEIARLLDMSPHTVRHHIRSIYAKLGISGKAGIAHLLHQLPPFS
ncbi:helix-turn-helix transcriptional regulator [Pseudogulbenkiania ferrooxidans]|uniref:Transcriptional regulator, LuxR family n=1 Tax=Pseudogulbenkiania ferrooxidans 2002 TaxID=279714 RepID=B9Z411_9NEIS|nr:helix-turn-helix transcriptional regulator [Pseudogulbenkiania ferrooxidans]EEG08588.1 transcriptional regulator, LuxR family [Pseudogulbenkiania ferrooxidans 2002]